MSAKGNNMLIDIKATRQRANAAMENPATKALAEDVLKLCNAVEQLVEKQHDMNDAMASMATLLSSIGL